MQGRGTVVTGRVEAGTIKVGDEIEVLGLASGGVPRKSVVTGVEMFHRSMTQAQAGDNVGLLLRGIRKGDVERGQVQSLLLTILFSYNSLLTGMLLVCRRKARAQTKRSHGGQVLCSWLDCSPGPAFVKQLGGQL